MAKKDPPDNCGESGCRGCSVCDDLYIWWLVKHDFSVAEGWDWPAMKQKGLY